MKTRDFFILIIKLYGLYSLVTAAFYVIPSTLPYMLAYTQYEGDVALIILSVFLISFMVVLTYVLMKKAGNIVDFLKVQHGFEVEEINLGMLSEKGIVKIAFIILGVFLFVDELPNLVLRTLDAFRTNPVNDYLGDDEVSHLPWILSLFKTFAGLILASNYKNLQEKLFKRSE